MIRPSMKTHPGRVIAAAILALLPAAVLQAATLEGRWKLVEQRYGSGRANLVAVEPPVRLEFYLAESRLSGRIWVEGDRSKPLPWPSFPSEHGPLPVEVRQLTIGAGSDVARARYRVRLAESEGEVLEVVEEYRLAEKGRVLVGTVTVAFPADGPSRGSYVLQRRFEREP
jgi:hypothetical protein